MKRFGQFYLDKEKDIVVELTMEGERLHYLLRTPNHNSGNLITNLAKLCELPLTLDDAGLKVIRGEIPCYVDGENRRLYIFRMGNTKIANIFPDGSVEMKASIPSISKVLMSQTRDYRLGVAETIVKTYLFDDCKFRTDLHTHMNGNLEPDVLIALGIRGHNYGQEWASNFLVGSEGDHVGFVDARDKVLSFLRQYIASMGITMILFVVLTFAVNGFSMCVTTANTGFMADIIDYELDRGGKYIPAVVTGTYSLVDKIVSSFSAAIATGCVALIGYTSTMPQPNDPATPGVFYMTMFLRYGLAILGFICTLLAMRTCKLDKAEMVNVQKRIADKKAAAQEAFYDEELHKGDPANA